MFIIEVEFLTGRYAATAHDDRRRAEWPPHPARFFSALVASFYEGPRTPAERQGLLWLEQQPAPALEVSEATMREVLDVYVPVNDVSPLGDLEAPVRERIAALEELRTHEASAAEIRKAEKSLSDARSRLQTELRSLNTPVAEPPQKTLDKAQALLPERRTRQVRTFPVAVPANPVFSFGWPETPPPELVEPLSQLCGRVTRLGHSSSLVWCRTNTSRALKPTWVPRDDGRLVLRTVGPGQLDRLDRAFEQHQGITGRVLPARPQRYDHPEARRAQALQSSFASDGWLLFERVSGARPLGSKGIELCRALRAALLEQHGEKGMPASLSGHEADGRPTTRPHVAFIALPWVGDEHADGSIKACAIVPPRDLSAEDRRLLLRLVAQWEQARASAGRVTLAGDAVPPTQFERVQLPTMKSSTPATWTRPSTRFVTATPIALDRNPGNLRSNFEQTATKAAREAEDSIKSACEHIGLPRPKDVQISLAPLLQGSQAARAFNPSIRAGRAPKVRVHAMLEFEAPVQGPLVLGAGRYLGLGLCLPMEVHRES